MAMQRAYQRYTFEQYLKTEEQYPDRKFEYVKGQIREIARGTFEHTRIALNLITKMDVYLRNGPCQVVHSDVHVFPLGEKDPSYLPDVTVTCTPSGYDPASKGICFPILIIEVLSDSTEFVDRNEKRLAYQACPRCKKYLIVNTKRSKIEAFCRVQGENWTEIVYMNTDPVLLVSVGLRITMDEIYRRTRIP